MITRIELQEIAGGKWQLQTYEGGHRVEILVLDDRASLLMWLGNSALENRLIASQSNE